MSSSVSGVRPMALDVAKRPTILAPLSTMLGPPGTTKPNRPPPPLQHGLREAAILCHLLVNEGGGARGGGANRAYGFLHYRAAPTLWLPAHAHTHTHSHTTPGPTNSIRDRPEKHTRHTHTHTHCRKMVAHGKHYFLKHRHFRLGPFWLLQAMKINPLLVVVVVDTLRKGLDFRLDLTHTHTQHSLTHSSCCYSLVCCCTDNLTVVLCYVSQCLCAGRRTRPTPVLSARTHLSF